MTSNPPKRQVLKEDSSVLPWLLDSDPSIRWQVMRDLGDEPEDVVAEERSKVGEVGSGAQLLARQAPDGTWAGDPSNPEWSCFLALMRLRDLGLDPSSSAARRAVSLVRDNVTWHWWDNHPFFVGEVEPCINGRIVTLGAYFGQDVNGLVNRLVGEQMEDGGWNCEQENGSTRGSFHTTINVLEGLLEHERATGGSADSRSARLRGEEYLLERQMLHRLSTGEIIDPAFAQLSFPTGYHYDILRGLEYMRSARTMPDARMSEAIEIITSKRMADGRWPLENMHPDQLEAEPGETEGQPSRWNTLRALRVLDWYSLRD
jgi:hypothetical protein